MTVEAITLPIACGAFTYYSINSLAIKWLGSEGSTSREVTTLFTWSDKQNTAKQFLNILHTYMWYISIYVCRIICGLAAWQYLHRFPQSHDKKVKCDLYNGQCKVIFHQKQFLLVSIDLRRWCSAIPVILGMPSSLGTGRVMIKPWAVPTHNNPWQIRRLVTRMFFWPVM